MKTKERKFDVALNEVSPTSWQVVIYKHHHSQTVARIEQRDDQHFEVHAISDHNAAKVTVNSLEQALNSALMQYNLHLH